MHLMGMSRIISGKQRHHFHLRRRDTVFEKPRQKDIVFRRLHQAKHHTSSTLLSISYISYIVYLIIRCGPDECHLICVFNPACTGEEKQGPDGSFELLEQILGDNILPMHVCFIGHLSLVGMLLMVMLMDKWVIGCVNFTVKLNRAKLFIHAATICIDQPAQHASTRDMGGQSAAEEGKKM